ncbi:TraR/DksA family transcriptional regulator [Candidatus Dependentiae bacterium]|nr:TraR/DksA family transcriptional regulator [Candidatus Dependentiae bacterium]
MSKKQELELIKKELLERKKKLEETLESLSTEKVADTQSQDDGDQVVSITMESLRSSLQDAEYQEYKMIVDALQAIDEGTYGICQDCGEPISEKRLKYNPNARRCLLCQQKQEEQNNFNNG